MSERYVPPEKRDLSKAKNADPFFPLVTIICRTPRGPYRLKCRRCRTFDKRVQTISGAVGAASEHQRNHAAAEHPETRGAEQ